MSSTSDLPSRLRSISPPPSSSRKRRRVLDEPLTSESISGLEGDRWPGAAEDTPERAYWAENAPGPTPAAIEAGRADIDNHLECYLRHFSEVRKRVALKQLASGLQSPPLSISSFSRLYTENAGSSRGHHFVIHQHDHPQAGLHYDLRLQFSATSSASWSVNKGLPGNPNESQNHGRWQAIETRVHPLWTHLNESANRRSGSQLIWDTGTYEVLPYRDDEKLPMTDDEDDFGAEEAPSFPESEPEKFQKAFRSRRIRVRLHGTRLPPDYTIRMRYSQSTESNIRQGQGLAPRKTEQASGRTVKPRRQKQGRAKVQLDHDSESEADTQSDPEEGYSKAAGDQKLANTDEWIRMNNAYPGSSNTIASVRGRSWVIYLDHRACGFRKKRVSGEILWRTDCADKSQIYPFVVRGRDVERSIVTGRMAKDVQEDEGIFDYIPKAGWAPILR